MEDPSSAQAVLQLRPQALYNINILSKQASKQASQRASKQASRQAGKQASRQAGRQAGKAPPGILLVSSPRRPQNNSSHRKQHLSLQIKSFCQPVLNLSSQRMASKTHVIAMRSWFVLNWVALRALQAQDISATAQLEKDFVSGSCFPRKHCVKGSSTRNCSNVRPLRCAKR